MTGRPKKYAQTKLENFQKALSALQLSLGSPVREARDLSGIIKDFEVTYELAWNALKAFLAAQGHETKSAKDVFAKAYRLGYLDQEQTWLDMISDRNLTVHTYDQEFAAKMADRIRTHYFPALQRLSISLMSEK